MLMKLSVLLEPGAGKATSAAAVFFIVWSSDMSVAEGMDCDHKI